MDLESHLQEEDLDGILPPGSKINISALKEKYQVSLAPLREALSRLATTGLLVSQPNVGFSVAPVSEEELLNLYETSAHLESLALSQTLKKGDEAWEEEIISSLYQLEKVELSKKRPSYEVWSGANTRFHDALIGCASDIVKELRASLHLKMARYVRIAFGKAIPHLKEFHKEHQALAQALLKRDQKLADKLMSQHISRGRDLLLAKLKEEKREL